MLINLVCGKSNFPCKILKKITKITHQSPEMSVHKEVLTVNQNNKNHHKC